MTREEPAEPLIVVRVRELGPAALAAGLRPAGAARLLAEAPSWRYPVLRCMGCDLITRRVLVDRAWQGRALIYCAGCGQAELQV